MTDGEVTQRIEKRDGEQVIVTFKGGKEVSVEPHIRPITGYLPGTSRAFVAGRGISEEEAEAAQRALEQRLEAEALTRAEEQRLAEIEKAQLEQRRAQEAAQLRSQAQMIEQPTVTATIEEQAGIMRPTVSPLGVARTAISLIQETSREAAEAGLEYKPTVSPVDVSRRALALIQETAREAAERGVSPEMVNEYLRTKRAELIADLPRATVAKIERLSKEATAKGIKPEDVERVASEISAIREIKRQIGLPEEQIKAKVTKKELEDYRKAQKKFEVRPEVIGTEAAFALGQRVITEAGRQYAPTIAGEIGGLFGAAFTAFGAGVGIATAERAIRDPFADLVVSLGEQTGVLGALGYERREVPGVSPFAGITEPILSPLADIGEGLIGYVGERPLEFITGLGVSALAYYTPEIVSAAGSTLKSAGKKTISAIKNSNLRNKVRNILKREKKDVLDVDALLKAQRRGELSESQVNQIFQDIVEAAENIRAESGVPYETIPAPTGRGFIDVPVEDIFTTYPRTTRAPISGDIVTFGKARTSQPIDVEDVFRIDLGDLSDDLSRIGEEVAEQAQATTQTTQLAMKPPVVRVEKPTRVAGAPTISVADVIPPDASIAAGISVPVSRPIRSYLGIPFLGALFGEEEEISQAPMTAEEQLILEETGQIPARPTLSAVLPEFASFVAAAAVVPAVVATAQQPQQVFRTIFEIPTQPQPVARAPARGAVGGAAGRAPEFERRGYLTLPGEEYTASVGAVLLGLEAEEVPVGAELALRPTIRKGGRASGRRTKPTTRGSKQKPKPKSKPKAKPRKRKERGFLSDLEQIDIGI